MTEGRRAWGVGHGAEGMCEASQRQHVTCVTPERSILKRLTDQFPEAIAVMKPLVMMSSRIDLETSKASRRPLTLPSSCVAARLISAHSFLKRSSKSRESSWPASSSRLFP